MAKAKAKTPPIKLNYTAREVPLPDLIDGKITFVAATIFDEPPLPFAIVNYKRSGKLQKKGLRMDLDKRIFLDHFDDAAFQQTLDTTAHTVAAAIGQARRAPAKTAASSAGD